MLHGVDDVWCHRHPHSQDAEPQRHRVWTADGDPRAHRVTDPRAARDVDRQVWRPDRPLRPDAGLRSADLSHRARNRILAIPRARPLRGAGRRLVLRGHALRCALVSEEPAGLCDGSLRCRQLGRGRQQVRRAGTDRGLRLDGCAAGLRGRHARRGNPLLVRQLFRAWPPGRRHGHLAAATGCLERSQGVEAVPVLLHRVWRLRGDEPLDGSVLHRRIWSRHTCCGIAGRMFLAARRRAARRGRVDFRQVWGAQRHMVGALGQLGLLVPALLSADRHDDPYDERSEDVPHRSQRLAVHDTHVRAWNRVGIRQGVGVQVHLRRLSDQHRRHFRCRRTCRGNGRICVADHVRRADGSHRGALLGLHAAVWSGLGVADLDVLDRSAQHRASWTAGRAVPPAAAGRSKSTKEGNEREQFSSRYESRRSRAAAGTSSTGAPRTTRSGRAPARRSPTATSGYRSPRCCADSLSGECGGSSPCRCSTWASRSARPSFSR